ncbi:MAG: hypothetical protein K8T89_13800 [Planctomycetes bacterium]|nr:hypothetical protein [Planctomycetota bacterium]
MSELVVDLPADVRAEIARRAGEGADAEAAWVAEAVRERLAACAARERLAARGARGSREAFERVLDKAADAPPIPGDEW